ncbi:MAG TPA: tetratricopeptide repeat protein [Bacteroidales bacterium]|nr:tetratricopeptide repeat protein [Bacteroidales bacterium]
MAVSKPKYTPPVPKERKFRIREKLVIKPWSPKKANRFIILSFLVWAFVLYGNTLWNKYSVDDELVTGPNNALVSQGLKAVPQVLKSPYYINAGNLGTQASDYRPVVKITFLLEHQLFGKDRPMASHGINILLYFAIGALIFLVLRRLLKEYNILFPYLITLLFMAHPVHTEVVASLKNRDELLAFLFGMWGLYCLLDYAEKKKIRYLIYTALLFVVGYLSKSSIVPFLAIYPLTLYFFTDVKPRNLAIIFGGLLVLMLAAHYLPRLYLIHVSRVNAYIENPLYFEKNFWIRTGTGLITLLYYLRLLFYPHPLIFYYGYDMVPVTGWGNIWVLLSFVIHAGLLITAILLFRKKSILSYAIFYYLIAIFMYSNMVVPAVGMMAERFVFNASLGFTIAIVWAVFRIFRTEPRSLTIELADRLKILAVIIVLLLPCAYLTYDRTRAWKTLYSLYRFDIDHMKRSVKGNLQYAGYLMNTIYQDPNFQQYGVANEFKVQTIITHYRRALRIYPNDYKSLNELGSVYLMCTKRPDSAVVFLQKAIRMAPEKQTAWVNLALAYRGLKKYDSALICYNRILQINPNEIKAKYAIGDVYFESGHGDQAVKLNLDMMDQFPDSEIPYINIGRYYFLVGDTTVALKYLEQSVQKRVQPNICRELSYLFRIRGDMEKAEYYNRLAGQSPGKPN